MAKHCETFDHTADVGLAATADSLAELFEALGEGLAEVICPIAQVTPAQTRTVSVQAEDVEALAVDFLTRIVVTIESDLFALAEVAVRDISETRVEADLKGEPYDPSRHEFHTEVKAVTYHQLAVACEDGKWSGRVILDI